MWYMIELNETLYIYQLQIYSRPSNRLKLAVEERRLQKDCWRDCIHKKLEAVVHGILLAAKWPGYRQSHDCFVYKN